MLSQQMIKQEWNPSIYLEQALQKETIDRSFLLSKKKWNYNDLALFLVWAEKDNFLLEQAALLAQKRTVMHFGYTIQFYTPLYLSSFCVNSCPYCSFHKNNVIERKILNTNEIEKECKIIREEGFSHILLVAGEHPIVSLDYLIEAIRIAKKYFSFVAIEVAPLNESDYRELKKVGLDGVTLYQETYDTKKYAEYHSEGPKADYAYRLDTMERAGKAGIKKLNIGSLLGLNDYRLETLYLAYHLEYLKKVCWQSEIAISFPRIRENKSGFQPPYPVSSKHLLIMIVGLRLFDEKVGLNLSTRESENFRNHAFKLGITGMSASSKTNPGGHSGEKSETQFHIYDTRNLKQLTEFLKNNGYDPVYKDWEVVL